MRFFPKKAFQYIFFEIWPPLILGLFVFVFILLMFQALRLTEFVLIHGVGLDVIVKMMSYLAISFLPVIFPMSLLFAILMTYGRLSADSELIGLKACGHSMWTLASPAFAISIIVSMLSAQTSFHLAPQGNRQFEILIGKLSKAKTAVNLREGTFSEGFYDLVVYANKVDSKKGQLEKVFIYDERNGNIPLTIISKKGKMFQESQETGNTVLLRLLNGDIHRKTDTHTKIEFNSFDIRLSNFFKEELREKSYPSLTIEEIQARLKEKNFKEADEEKMLRSEFHKRWAVTLLCLIFGLLGVALGTNVNERHQKSSGLVTSLGVVILYWILYITFESFARQGKIPVALAIWTPNFLFLIFAFYKLKKVWI